MLNLEQKKLKKKILDNLVLGVSDIINTPNGLGEYANNVDVNFINKTVTINYYLTNKKEGAYSPAKELLAGGQIFNVQYSQIPRPNILKGLELIEYQSKFKKKN